MSKTVTVPIGEFDGQLVISGSYCYPVRKFLIEQDGGVVNLELDATKFESNEDFGKLPWQLMAPARQSATL